MRPSPASPLSAISPRFGPTKLYAPFFYDATRVAIAAMKLADSTDPARFGPRIRDVVLDGATGRIAFDARGDRLAPDMTILVMKGGQIVPVATYGADGLKPVAR